MCEICDKVNGVFDKQASSLEEIQFLMACGIAYSTISFIVDELNEIEGSDPIIEELASNLANGLFAIDIGQGGCVYAFIPEKLMYKIIDIVANDTDSGARMISKFAETDTTKILRYINEDYCIN